MGANQMLKKQQTLTSNKTQALTKSMNMDISIVDISHQFFIEGY